jgi:hypothetical protein
LSSDGASREWLIESRERLEDINKASSSKLRLVTNKKQVIIEIESRGKLKYIMYSSVWKVAIGYLRCEERNRRSEACSDFKVLRSWIQGGDLREWRNWFERMKELNLCFWMCVEIATRVSNLYVNLTFFLNKLNKLNFLLFVNISHFFLVIWLKKKSVGISDR